jgi:two-component system, NarL family, sensor kinase
LIKGLTETTGFANQIGKGNFKAAYTPLSEDDVLGNTLIQMRDRIVELQHKELTLVRQRTSALLEGQEKERQRLARELHDGIGQLLTGIRYKIEASLLDDIGKKSIKELLDETIKEVRRISHSAMPSVLSDFGLNAALKALCINVGHIGNLQVEFEFELGEKENDIDFEMSTTLYRIAQEGLNNCLKYAEASKVLLEITATENTILFELSDNGKGFDVKKNRLTGHGLVNMEKRAKIIGGNALITSTIGKGSKIKIELPFTKDDKN